MGSLLYARQIFQSVTFPSSALLLFLFKLANDDNLVGAEKIKALKTEKIYYTVTICTDFNFTNYNEKTF